MAFALAFVSLALRILVPQGFMPSPTNPLSIVICTGHGPMMMGMAEHGKPTKPSKDKTDHVCPFAAGAGSTLALDLHSAKLAPHTIELEILVGAVLDQIPGRGLAAPPPPSHAPPVRLT